jgi:hypothetical protein
LAASLKNLAAPESPTLVEIDSARAALRLISHDVARAENSVQLVAPSDAFPLLKPVLRRAASADLALNLRSVGPTEGLSFASVEPIDGGYRWPGMPLLSVVDDKTAVIASRQGSDVRGYWGRAEAFVAAARLSIERLGT